ncbi:capsule assembly Wzi family protein [Sphingobacterium paludis]|uniref:Capsule assembly protein Wzi n=1 Tax=Sphingobacterium paludis TaxID=1476465 RepID=A0A4R7D0B2_9SPHI|nr:capsule assembly Wzi family protein [Sphingobacterium paludis]TDS13737.1 capsule assembly protein Wzi [Sphingobacterium paludis]
MKQIALSILLMFSLAAASAQDSFSDSLRIEVGTQVQVASKGFQPLWAKANRFGLASNEQFDQLTWLEASNTHRLGSMRLLSDTASAVKLSYGATVFNAEHYRRTVLQQGYVQLTYKDWFIRGGRHRDLWDDLDPDLSMGSLGTSGNALPIPKITIGVNDFVRIPWTKGVLEFKGMLGHGWFGDNRFMDSWLHEKSFYGRINFGKWKPYGGVQHYTEWGGQRPANGISLDRSFRGFLDVLFVSESNDGSVPDIGIRPNRAGDQRGLAELGFYFDSDKFSLHFYNQTPFESGKGIDIRNMDRLAGLRLDNKNRKHWLQSVVVEFIYTKQMEGFSDGERQSLYNNGSYKTGWEYEGKVVGNALLTNRTYASDYLPIEPLDWVNANNESSNIINNRLVGGNVAGQFKLSDSWAFRAKVTPVINYGSRQMQYLYGDGQFECYSLMEIRHTIGQWKLGARVAADFGQLYSNVGGILSVNYAIR